MTAGSGHHTNPRQAPTCGLCVAHLPSGVLRIRTHPHHSYNPDAEHCQFQWPLPVTVRRCSDRFGKGTTLPSDCAPFLASWMAVAGDRPGRRRPVDWQRAGVSESGNESAIGGVGAGFL